MRLLGRVDRFFQRCLQIDAIVEAVNEELDGLRVAYGYNSWEVAFKKGLINTQCSGSIIQKACLDKDMMIWTKVKNITMLTKNTMCLMK